MGAFESLYYALDFKILRLSRRARGTGAGTPACRKAILASLKGDDAAAAKIKSDDVVENRLSDCIRLSK